MNILTAGVEIVAPDGDIVFLVGASKKGVQVDSAVLKKASPVFATNLGEGPGLRARGENRFLLVELPDDNAETFIMIAKLIHGVRINPTLDEIFSISDSVEKYKFSSPFSAALGFDTWTESLASCRNTHSLWKLLVCAYNLELDDTFAATSQQLILIEQQGAIGELAVTTPDFEPSLKLACALEKLRSKALVHLAKVMGDDAIALISTFYEDCPHNLHLLFAFMERFRHVLEDEEGVVSFHNLPLEETINIFKNFESLRRDENHGRDSFKMTKGSFNEMCECSHHITFGELAEVVSDNAVMCQEELTRLDLENFKKGRY